MRLTRACIPVMVKSLLTVASDIFVARHGVKVILTTHSPTTVALAPEESLYVMSRDKTPRIRKADRDEAVAALAIGLSTLSVRHQNRRQVFVESEYDEQYYQEMFRKLLRSNLHPEISLEFIASGKGRRGDCSAVEHLVTNLRDRGNDSVWGIVDRDIRTDAPRGIVFLSTRYSIENLILDPLILASFMLREQLLTAQAVSLPDDIPHYQLSAEHAQTMMDHIVSKIATSTDDRTLVPTEDRGQLRRRHSDVLAGDAGPPTSRSNCRSVPSAPEVPARS